MIKSDIDASWITGFLSAFEELNRFSPIQNYFEFKPLGPEPIDDLLEHLRERRNAQLTIERILVKDPFVEMRKSIFDWMFVFLDVGDFPFQSAGHSTSILQGKVEVNVDQLYKIAEKLYASMMSYTESESVERIIVKDRMSTFGLVLESFVLRGKRNWWLSLNASC